MFLKPSVSSQANAVSVYITERRRRSHHRGEKARLVRRRERGQSSHLVLKLLIDRSQFFEVQSNLDQSLNHWMVLHAATFGFEQEVEHDGRAITQHQKILGVQVRNTLRRRERAVARGVHQGFDALDPD